MFVVRRSLIGDCCLLLDVVLCVLVDVCCLLCVAYCMLFGVCRWLCVRCCCLMCDGVCRVLLFVVAY